MNRIILLLTIFHLAKPCSSPAELCNGDFYGNTCKMILAARDTSTVSKSDDFACHRILKSPNYFKLDLTGYDESFSFSLKITHQHITSAVYGPY